MWPLYVIFAAAVLLPAAACLVRNKIVKGLLSAVSILPALLSAVLLAGFVLPVYMGVHGVWMGFALCGGGDAIMAYQRPEESGSQIMLREIMGDTPIMPAPQEDVYETMMGMLRRVANYRNYKNSLGYSFMFYVQGMVGEHGVKLLSVDGTPPARENIASGAYPFSHDFYAVTAKRDGGYLNPGRADNIDALLEWILSPQGQYLVDATGYVAV